MTTDTAYSLDPRIKKFKEAEKAEKEARKKARAEAARQEALERERVGTACNVYLYVCQSHDGHVTSGGAAETGCREGAEREGGRGGPSSSETAHHTDYCRGAECLHSHTPALRRLHRPRRRRML